MKEVIEELIKKYQDKLSKVGKSNPSYDSAQYWAYTDIISDLTNLLKQNQ